MSNIRFFIICFLATLLSQMVWEHRTYLFTTSICFFDSLLNTNWDKVCK